MLGSVPLGFCPKIQAAGAASVWNTGTQGRGQTGGTTACLGSRVTTCREGLPEMEKQHHATRNIPPALWGQMATL